MTRRNEIEVLFEATAVLMKWDTEYWGDDGRPKKGAVSLDYNAACGGYQIVCVTNKHGGETQIGFNGRYSAARIEAWLLGAQYAKQ